MSLRYYDAPPMMEVADNPLVALLIVITVVVSITYLLLFRSK